MTDPAADAARSAAVILAPDLGPGLPAEVEAALYASATTRGPDQYDPIAIAGLGIAAASLIVIVAQLAWTILSDQRKHTAEPSHESISRQVRITLRQQDLILPAGTDHITDVVITETIRLDKPPE
jgi:hypothetical protein